MYENWRAWSGDDSKADLYEASANALKDAATEGSLVVSDIVHAALCIHFETQRESDTFLESNEIRIQALSPEAHFLASRARRTYREEGGKRTRILADFLIGAHAQKQTMRLLSRDRASTVNCFPRLTSMTRRERTQEIESMSLFKRGNVWWYEFWFANRRVREFSKTNSKTPAMAGNSSADASPKRDSIIWRMPAKIACARSGKLRRTTRLPCAHARSERRHARC
ncbi:MAG TPA: hypothetical protein VHZ55_13450 [Bryobacteraceae bacterium]|nr:hypothetical protein [Bryobacteraceae bacterium]